MDIFIDPSCSELCLPHSFLSIRSSDLLNQLNPLIKNNFDSSVKINFYFKLKMEKLEEDGNVSYSESEISSTPEGFNPNEGISPKLMETICNDLATKFNTKDLEGSGWSVHSIITCAATVVACDKFMRGDKGIGRWCPIPHPLHGRQQLINIHPRYAPPDFNCVKACVKLHLASLINPVILEPQTNYNKFRYNNLMRNYREFSDAQPRFPAYANNRNEFFLDQFSEIENMNNISLIVYRLYTHQNRKTLSLIRKGKNGVPEQRKIYLLQISDNHVCYIRNIDTFLRRFYDIDPDREVCKTCFVQFKNKTQFNNHITAKLCQYKVVFPTKIVLPNDNSKLSFKSLGKTCPPHLVCYADSESKLLPNIDETNPQILHTHKMVSFGYVILNGVTGQMLTYKRLFGEDVSKDVVPTLRYEFQKYHDQFVAQEHPIKMTSADHKKAKETTHCKHCNVQLTFGKKAGTLAVNHHDHTKAGKIAIDSNGEEIVLEGNFIDRICSRCNTLLVNKRRSLNIFMHNGGGYDFNLFLKDIEKKKKENVFILPKQASKYYTFSIGNLVFKDTINFLPFSLDKMVESLRKDDPNFKLTITHKILEQLGYSKELIEKTVGKGSFPYEAINSLDIFNLEGVPPRHMFDSSLTGPISDEKYEHVKEIYKDPKINTVKDLHDLYLACDVGIICDCFQYFRKFSNETWELDPTNYITSASMYLDAALKESNQELDLISDPNLYEVLEKSICGGFVSVVKRKAFANNVDMGDLYDPAKPDSHLLLLDFNGLYAGIQQEKLPTGSFNLMSDSDTKVFEKKLLNNEVVFDGDTAYWVECDIEIPDNTAIKTDDLPLSMYVADNIRGSDYMNAKLRGKPRPNGAKLVATHLPVKKGSYHIKWLSLLVELGLKVTKLHRVWSFKQSAFLKSYVTKNINLRAKEKNELLRTMLKLASNAPYGKLLEQKRKRTTKSTFVETAQQVRQHCKSPFYKSLRRLGNNRCIIERYVEQILLDVPIYVGNTILQLSKHQFWEFYYLVLKPHFGDNVQILYCDTDSMMLQIFVDKGTSLKDLLEKSVLKDWVDRSNLKNEALRDNKFKGQSGKLKSETADDCIVSAFMLKPKLYSIQTLTGRKVANKGVNMKNIEPVPHELFRQAVDDPSISAKRPQTNIRKVDEDMCTVRYEKETINTFENKRFWLDSNTSYAYGHPAIRNMVGGNQCLPIRFECNPVVENVDNTEPVTAMSTIEDDEIYGQISPSHEECDIFLGAGSEHEETSSKPKREPKSTKHPIKRSKPSIKKNDADNILHDDDDSILVSALEQAETSSCNKREPIKRSKASIEKNDPNNILHDDDDCILVSALEQAETSSYHQRGSTKRFKPLMNEKEEVNSPNKRQRHCSPTPSTLKYFLKKIARHS